LFNFDGLLGSVGGSLGEMPTNSKLPNLFSSCKEEPEDSALFPDESKCIPNSMSNTNTPPRPPTVANTTQLLDTSPLEREGTRSHVETKSLITDLPIDKIEKVTGPAVPPIAPASDKLQTQTDIDSLWSESWQEISSVAEAEE
jgi:hypothetical protein